jgi:hypothetical protein
MLRKALSGFLRVTVRNERHCRPQVTAMNRGETYRSLSNRRFTSSTSDRGWPFRIVVGLLTVLGLLVTGVATLKFYDQLQAMQRRADEAKRYVETSKDQIAEAKTVIANRQAELALLVLKGDETQVD